jgi:hypothetical protein
MKNNVKITNFHKCLQILSKKLNQEDYALVGSTLFELYAGKKFGYKPFDQQFLIDVHLIWKINHEKSIKNKAKILKFKVLQGGKAQK